MMSQLLTQRPQWSCFLLVCVLILDNLSQINVDDGTRTSASYVSASNPNE